MTETSSGYRYSMLPLALTLDLNVSARATRIWAYLAHLVWSGSDFPTRRELAEAMGCSIRSVDFALEELVENGWLTKQRCTPRGASAYLLIADPASGTVVSACNGVQHEASALQRRTATCCSHTVYIEGFREVLRSRENRDERNPPKPGLRAVPPEANLPDPDADMRRASKAPSEGGSASSPRHRPGSGAGLARTFRRAAEAAFSRKQLGVDAFNDGALASTLARWKRDGITGEQIQTMIEVFVTEPLRPGVPLWKGFLAQRARLLEQASKVALDDMPVTERYRADYTYDDN